MSLWSSISKDPEAQSVIEWRRKTINASQSRGFSSYADFIEFATKDAVVMDFGAANHSSSTSSIGGNSTHDLVHSFAKNVTAVDIEPFNSETKHADCTYIEQNLLDSKTRNNVELNSKFDVLFAGNVIEHLNSPGDIFELARTVLKPNGKLQIAVPNALWIIGIFDLFTERNSSINVDHVNLYYPGSLIELAERNGFEVLEWRYFGKGDMVKAFRPGNIFQKSPGD